MKYAAELIGEDYVAHQATVDRLAEGAKARGWNGLHLLKKTKVPGKRITVSYTKKGKALMKRRVLAKDLSVEEAS